MKSDTFYRIRIKFKITKSKRSHLIKAIWGFIFPVAIFRKSLSVKEKVASGFPSSYGPNEGKEKRGKGNKSATKMFHLHKRINTKKNWNQKMPSFEKKPNRINKWQKPRETLTFFNLSFLEINNINLFFKSEFLSINN